MTPTTNRMMKLARYLFEHTSFMDSPASSRHHLAIPGGLNTHCDNVHINLKFLTRQLGLKWTGGDESVYIVAYGHDVCKIGAYERRPDGTYMHAENFPKGHGDLSVERLKKIIHLTEEEETCIRWHMGAFDDPENWSKYTEAIHKFPNVLWTHTADMMATHIDEKGE